MKAEVPTLCQLCSAQIGLYRDSGERKKGQRPLLSGCWCSFLSLQQGLHTRVNSPSMLLAAAFLRWLWAEEVPKIIRQALPQVVHSLWWPQGRLACSRQASVPLAPAQFLWLPPSQLLSGASTFPFIVLRVSPGGRGPHYRPRSPARYYLGTLVPPCPCRPCWHS